MNWKLSLYMLLAAAGGIVAGFVGRGPLGDGEGGFINLPGKQQ